MYLGRSRVLFPSDFRLIGIVAVVVVISGSESPRRRVLGIPVVNVNLPFVVSLAVTRHTVCKTTFERV